MSLKKMLMLASMALAAIAFAVPAAAQGNVLLTDEDGALEEGALVTASSGDLRTTTAGGTLECGSVELHFELLTNGLNHVELLQLGAATTSGCALNRHALEVEPFTLPVAITDGTVGVGEGSILTIDTWGQGSTNATFVSDIAGVLTCHLEGEVDFDMTHPSPNDELKVTPSVLTGGSPGCAPTGTIHGEFTLETDDGEPVYVDFDETTG